MRHKTVLTWDLHLNGFQKRCCSQRWISQLLCLPHYPRVNKAVIWYGVSLVLHTGKNNSAPNFPKSNRYMQSPFSKGKLYLLKRRRWTGKARKQRRVSLGTRWAGMLWQRVGTRGITGTSAKPSLHMTTADTRIHCLETETWPSLHTFTYISLLRQKLGKRQDHHKHYLANTTNVIWLQPTADLMMPVAMGKRRERHSEN